MQYNTTNQFSEKSFFFALLVKTAGTCFSAAMSFVEAFTPVKTNEKNSY